jgi:hypothetical protein
MQMVRREGIDKDSEVHWWLGSSPHRAWNDMGSLSVDGRQLFCVVDGAIPVVVVTHRAVENVIPTDTVKRFALRSAAFVRICSNRHCWGQVVAQAHIVAH